MKKRYIYDIESIESELGKTKGVRVREWGYNM